LAQQSNLTHPKYRPDIDGLRAIAVLSVVIFRAFPDSFKAGFIGVDVFFVISGFLISSIILENLDRGTFSFSEFYARRIKRIFPALSLVLLSCLVFGWFGLLEDEYKQLGKHVAAGAAFVSNFALWQESGYFNNAAETKPLLHLWSLAIEEQFYIVWPLLMWLIWKRKNLFIVTLIGLLIGSFAISLYLVRVDRVAAFYFPGSRVWQLLLGVVLAYLAVRPTVWQPSTTQRHGLSALGLALLALAAFKIDKNRPYPGSWALLPGLGAFFIIYAGSSAYINRFLLSNKMLVWIGLISFPLYLWHWPILSFMRIVESGTPEIKYRVGAISVSFLLAWLTYFFVEKPIRNVRSLNVNKQSALKTIVIFTLTVLLGASGWFVYRSGGMPERLAAQPDGINTWDNLTFATPCHFLTKGDNHDDWCNSGNAPAKPPTTVLIGDSVGNNFAPMLQQYADNSGDTKFVFRQFGRGLCHGFSEIALPNCVDLTQAAKAYIKETPSIDTVILAANWRLYYYGFERHGDTAITGAQFKAAFENNVAYYQSLGKRVIIFQAPPVGANPRACLTRPIRLAEQSNCNLDLKEALHNAGQSRDYVSSFAAARKIDVFDPFKYFCSEKSCKVTDGTQIYYLDHEHFTHFGGQFLAQAAQAELRALLSTPRQKH
jgi:peptidoglycan/LPS O-acetylase OafA/YrhL